MYRILNTYCDIVKRDSLLHTDELRGDNDSMGKSMESFGDRLAKARVSKKLTQSQLARAMGWNAQSRISMYERGEREPTLGEIEQLAKKLGVDPRELAYGAAQNLQPISPTADGIRAAIMAYTGMGFEAAQSVLKMLEQMSQERAVEPLVLTEEETNVLRAVERYGLQPIDARAIRRMLNDRAKLAEVLLAGASGTLLADAVPRSQTTTTGTSTHGSSNPVAPSGAVKKGRRTSKQHRR